VTIPIPFLPVCNTLWIGGALGKVERACLQSFVRHGHKVRLYAYGPVQGLPQGVELRDAELILPSSEIRCYADGSPALFSNRFRYELMRRGAGLWVDTDVYCLRPLDLPDPYLFGWEHETLICTAILRIPQGSALLERLLALWGLREPPPWLDEQELGWANAQVAHGGEIRWEELGWGLTGPRGLTWLINDLGLAEKAQPQTVLYPASPHDADWIFDPSTALEDVISAKTKVVHLWNKLISDRKAVPAPAGSFMSRLQREGAEAPAAEGSAAAKPAPRAAAPAVAAPAAPIRFPGVSTPPPAAAPKPKPIVTDPALLAPAPKPKPFRSTDDEAEAPDSEVETERPRFRRIGAAGGRGFVSE
jgi:hypothetical protein